MFRMTFEGGDEIARVLNGLPRQLTRRVVLDALMAAGEPIRARAEHLAPRSAQSRYGHLGDNIGISTSNRIGSTSGGRWTARDETEHAVAVGPTRSYFYGLFQEYGTVYHAAQPFMRPAFDEEAPAALQIMADELWWAIRRGIPASQERFAA